MRHSLTVKTISFFVALLLSISFFLDKSVAADTILDSARPFGFSWTLSASEKQELLKIRGERCRQQIEKLQSLLLGNDEKDSFYNECQSENAGSVFLLAEMISPELRDGEVYVVMNELFEPVQFEYSYLHKVLPNTSPSDAELRSQKATYFREILRSLYGQAVASGYFEQSSATGFIFSNESNSPCEVWLKQEIGILLCSQRVILIDGIEMSLSFINLDRAKYGKDFKRELKNEKEKPSPR